MTPSASYTNYVRMVIDYTKHSHLFILFIQVTQVQKLLENKVVSLDYSPLSTLNSQGAIEMDWTTDLYDDRPPTYLSS